jgi:hypothetical protein
MNASHNSSIKVEQETEEQIISSSASIESPGMRRAKDTGDMPMRQG